MSEVAKKRRTLTEKALLVIEALASDDFCVELEMGRKIMPKDKEIINKKFTDIYRFAHAVQGGVCYHVHDDYRRELVNTYRRMQRAKVI